ncbi:MAG TPA: ATP-binding protein [Candidatus Binatia bacterium]|nr:ATP-binding protein [Candidatus Binatia bacterium]
MRRPWKNSLIFKFFLSYLVIIGLLVLLFYLYFSGIEGSGADLTSGILIEVLAISLLGLVLAALFARQLGLRVQQMAEFSRQIATASFPAAPLNAQAEDELGTLEKHLNEMSLTLQEKLQAIVSEKEKLESVLRCMSEGVLVVDTQGRLILLNENARQMFKLSQMAPLTGTSLMEISRHPDMKNLMSEVLASDSSDRLTKQIALDDDKWFRVNAVSLLSGNGRVLGYVLVFHDITELKRLENVRADFVANVSHELRTPLSAIKGYAETLLHNPPQSRETSREFLEVIDRHSERLGRLIDDLLTLSDLESGTAQFAKQSIEVDKLVRPVLEIFQAQADRKGISLSRTVDPGVPAVSGDPDRLQQLLINLVDNALKYTPAQGAVRVQAQRSSRSNGDRPMVEIAVSDTGCGIPDHHIPRLTERFYRVDKARSRELGGTGLGLAIVKHIVQAHGGRLQVDSLLQKGTTVRVFLPAAKARVPFKEVLFLCTANSCRSQMAEAFARNLAPEPIAVYSAGTEPRAIHPLAIQVMKEVGVDISAQRSKAIEEIPLAKLDLIVALCEAAETCSILNSSAERLHWAIPDPAQVEGDETERLQAFRQARDEIQNRIRELFS